MARTWTLDRTWSSPNIDGRWNWNGVSCVNDDETKVYFFTQRSSGGFVVYEWDGITTNPTDISGSTFTDPDWEGAGIAYWNDTLWLLVDDGSSGAERVYLYTYDGSGTSWTLDQTLAGEDSHLLHERGMMACDDNSLVIYADAMSITQYTSNDSVFKRTTDGSTWYHQKFYDPDTTTLEGDLHLEMLYGKNHYSGHSEVVAFFDWGYDYRVISYTSGNNRWDQKVANPYACSDWFFGVLDESDSVWIQSWGSSNVGPSSDWNDTALSSPTTSLYNPMQTWTGRYQYYRHIATDARMACAGGDENCHHWNGTQFVADGSVDTGYNVVGFFGLNGTLYAVAYYDGAYGPTRIYDGGSYTSMVSPKTGYYKGDTSTGGVKQSDLPFGLATPDSHAISSVGLIALGSGEAALDDMVVISGTGEYWTGADEDIGNILTQQITSIRWLPPCAPNIGVPTGGVQIPTNTGQVINVPPGDPGQVLQTGEEGQPPTWVDANDHNHPLADITDAGALAALDQVQAGHVDSESATDGQVLTADGAGGTTWEDAAGGSGVIALHVYAFRRGIF